MHLRDLVPPLLLGTLVTALPLHAQAKPADLEAFKRTAVATLEAWNRGDATRLGDFIAEKGRWWMGGRAYPWSPRIEAGAMKGWLAAFPDTRVAIDDVIAEGDRVVLRTTWTGTHRGELEGIPPTGRTVKFTELLVYRFAGGKMVEVWVDWDELGLYRQLGALPPGSPRPVELRKAPEPAPAPE